MGVNCSIESAWSLFWGFRHFSRPMSGFIPSAGCGEGLVVHSCCRDWVIAVVRWRERSLDQPSHNPLPAFPFGSTGQPQRWFTRSTVAPSEVFVHIVEKCKHPCQKLEKQKSKPFTQCESECWVPGSLLNTYRAKDVSLSFFSASVFLSYSSQHVLRVDAGLPMPHYSFCAESVWGRRTA